MKPKDLKNSEELKSTKRNDLENSEKNPISEDLKNEEKEPQAENEVTEELVEENKKAKDEVIESVENVNEASDAVEEDANVLVADLVDEEKENQEMEKRNRDDEEIKLPGVGR